MKYEHIISYVLSMPWALMPEKLQAIMDLIALRASGGTLSEDDLAPFAAVSRPQASPSRKEGAVAVIPIFGTIMHRAGMFSDFSGGSSIERIRSDFRAAMSDNSVSAIVLNVDSPGGATDGVPEMADEIYEARAQKPVYALADTLAASAGYWLASSASEFYASPSALVGSIGVFAAHSDMSKAMDRLGVKTTLIAAGARKTEGNPYEPLSDDAREHIQTLVDGYYDSFVNAVARGRGTTMADVMDNYGQGRIMSAKAAKKKKMIDGVMTMDEVMKRAMRQTGQRQTARAEVADPIEQLADLALEARTDDPSQKDDPVTVRDIQIATRRLKLDRRGA